jgi:hypothetical protein
MAVPTSRIRPSPAAARADSRRPVSHETIGTPSRSATSSISAMTPVRPGRSSSKYRSTASVLMLMRS